MTPPQHNWPVWHPGSVPPQWVAPLQEILDGLLDGSIRMETIHTKGGISTNKINIEFLDSLRPPPTPSPQGQLSYPKLVSTPPSPPPGPSTPAIAELGVIAEPVIGFRDFVLRTSIDGPILMSRNDHPWPYRKRMRALCAAQNSGQPFSKHDAPALTCNCGIYAYARPDDPNLKATDIVWGEVAMWGEVLICEKGYRSQFAYPLNLFIRDNGTRNVQYLAEELQDMYGVPCYVVKARDGKTASEVMAEMIDGMLRDLGKAPFSTEDE